jgi:hypothetical protein
VKEKLKEKAGAAASCKGSRTNERGARRKPVRRKLQKDQALNANAHRQTNVERRERISNNRGHSPRLQGPSTHPIHKQTNTQKHRAKQRAQRRQLRSKTLARAQGAKKTSAYASTSGTAEPRRQGPSTNMSCLLRVSSPPSSHSALRR